MPRRATTTADLAPVLALIRAAFAYMDGVVDPPTTMHAMTPESLAAQARTGEVWSVGDPITACMVLTPQPPVLYVGKLAVAARHRGQGLCRLLIDHAEIRARALGLEVLELGTRVELTANQAAFVAMGFTEHARDCHPGFERHTSIIYRRPVAMDVSRPGP